MALKAETDNEVDLHDNSLDNSIRCDEEYLVDDMVDEGSIGSDDRNQIGSRHLLDTADGDTDHQIFTFREIEGSLSYRVIQMPTAEVSNMMTNSPANTEYYMLGDPLTNIVQPTVIHKKAIRKNPNHEMQSKVVTAKKRDDKRRATHNEVERRRRDKINSWIAKLQALVPNAGLPEGTSFNASKGGILAKACDHINELNKKQKRLEVMEVDYKKLVGEAMKLKQEVIELRRENASMRNQLADTCIVTQRSKGPKS